MKIENLPEKFLPLWEKCLLFLEKGRPGDDLHAAEVVSLVLSYRGKLKLDFNVLVPAAMMHDIGHCAILSEHFKYITGPEKVKNGKLVHMLAGAKIANDILDSLGYDKKKSAEIIDIISMHDADQLENTDIQKVYDTENKKIFHDLDSLDRFTEARIKSMGKIYPDKNKLLAVLRESLALFFFDEFRRIAESRFSMLNPEK